MSDRCSGARRERRLRSSAEMDRGKDKPKLKVTKELCNRVFEQCKNDLLSVLQSSKAGGLNGRGRRVEDGEVCRRARSSRVQVIGIARRGVRQLGRHRRAITARATKDGRLRDRDASVQSKSARKESGPDANITAVLSLRFPSF